MKLRDMLIENVFSLDISLEAHSCILSSIFAKEKTPSANNHSGYVENETRYEHILNRSFYHSIIH